MGLVSDSKEWQEKRSPMCQRSQRIFISSENVDLPGVGGKGFHHVQHLRKPRSL